MTLTKEEAIRLHRQMWSDMLKELGDCPSLFKRINFKIDWCKLNGYDDIDNHCFLCEYTRQEGLGCEACPIDWSSLSILSSGCGPAYERYSVSSIIALPERSD